MYPLRLGPFSGISPSSRRWPCAPVSTPAFQALGPSPAPGSSVTRVPTRPEDRLGRGLRGSSQRVWEMGRRLQAFGGSGWRGPLGKRSNLSKQGEFRRWGEGSEAPRSERQDPSRKLHPPLHAWCRDLALARVQKHPRSSVRPPGGTTAAPLTWPAGQLAGRLRQFPARRLRLLAAEVLGLSLLAPRHGVTIRAPGKSLRVAYFMQPSPGVRQLLPLGPSAHVLAILLRSGAGRFITSPDG